MLGLADAGTNAHKTRMHFTAENNEILKRTKAKISN